MRSLGRRVRHVAATARGLATDRRSPAVTVPSACYAPHAALYLRPDGVVQACCATGYEYGRIGGPDGRTLHDIWLSSEAMDLRRRLEAGRFDYGCQECELAIETGGRASSLAYHFDRWAPGAPHPYPKLLDLAMSNRCNLACVMCNGDLSSTIRAQREHRPPLPSPYDDAFFEEFEVFLGHAARVQFKGGEPFLAPESRRVWDIMLAHGHRAEVAVTTNGTIWNERVERYVRDLRMELNVSVDGVTPEVLEPIRVGTDCRSLWANIDRLHRATADVGRPITLSFCLMPQNWHELVPFLREVDRREVGCYVIFVNQPHRFDLLRLPPHELDRIGRQVEEDGTDLRTGPARRELAKVVERVRAQIDQPVVLKVRVMQGLRETVLPEPVDDADIDLDLLVAETRAWTGREPVVVTLTDEIIRDVNAPPWADWMATESWVGVHERTVPSLLEGATGGRLEVDTGESAFRGVADIRVGCAPPAGGRTLRVLALVDPEPGGRTVHWVIGERRQDEGSAEL